MAGVSSCGTERDRRSFWGKAFRRTLRAIDRSLRLIEASCRAVWFGAGVRSEVESEDHEFGPGRHLLTRHFQLRT